MSPHTPPPLVELITKCWDADPTNRPPFVEIKNTIFSLLFKSLWRSKIEESDSFRDLLLRQLHPYTEEGENLRQAPAIYVAAYFGNIDVVR